MTHKKDVNQGYLVIM